MVENNKSVAVYAGTFDPITNGHKDIIERALKVFDRVIIAVAKASSKNTLFSVEERVELIKGATAEVSSKIEVSSFNGLLVDFIKQTESSVIIRGLRAVADYEYEAQMALVNRELLKEVETVFFVTSVHCSFISSSIVKDVAKNGGNLASLVPKNVDEKLKQTFKRGNS